MRLASFRDGRAGGPLRAFAGRRRKSMADQLQLGIFVAVLIAFVVMGCLATRPPKKTPKTGPAKE